MLGQIFIKSNLVCKAFVGFGGTQWSKAICFVRFFCVFANIDKKTIGFVRFLVVLVPTVITNN